MVNYSTNSFSFTSPRWWQLERLCWVIAYRFIMLCCVFGEKLETISLRLYHVLYSSSWCKAKSKHNYWNWWQLVCQRCIPLQSNILKAHCDHFMQSFGMHGTMWVKEETQENVNKTQWLGKIRARWLNFTLYNCQRDDFINTLNMHNMRCSCPCSPFNQSIFIYYIIGKWNTQPHILFALSLEKGVWN